jgi:hypothetical protein
MNATYRHGHAADSGMQIRGTFYPSDGPGGGSIGSVVPKLLGVLVAMVVVRAVIGAKRGHGGSSRWSRRREAIAAFHRELHTEDAAAGAGEAANKAQ